VPIRDRNHRAFGARQIVEHHFDVVADDVAEHPHDRVQGPNEVAAFGRDALGDRFGAGCPILGIAGDVAAAVGAGGRLR
jgi:hypothetical protein